MALIKCPECGKEISDKAPKCIHCGYPLKKEPKKEEKVEPKPKQTKKAEPENLDGLTSAWLIIATLICFGIALIQLVSPIVYRLSTSNIYLGSLIINTKVDIRFILDVLLGISYINIMLSKNKLSMIIFYVINALLIIINLICGLNIISLMYFVCIVLNVIITTFAVRGRLKNDYKISPASITISIIGIILSILASLMVFREVYLNNLDHSVYIDVFYIDNCKYCEDFFQYVEDVDTFIHIKKLNAQNQENYNLLKDVAASYGLNEENIAYPFILINNRYYLGYSEDNKNDIDKWIHKISEKGESYDFLEKFNGGNKITDKTPANDNRSPREKLISYLQENEKANCTNSKCTYSFTFHAIDDNTTYYTVDFDKKIFRTDSNIDGPQYEIYNFQKNTGQAYMESNTGFHVEVNVDVTFTENEYNYTWKGSIKGLDQTAEIMAGQVDSLRTQFYKWCNELSINPQDI